MKGLHHVQELFRNQSAQGLVSAELIFTSLPRPNALGRSTKKMLSGWSCSKHFPYSWWCRENTFNHHGSFQSTVTLWLWIQPVCKFLEFCLEPHERRVYPWCLVRCRTAVVAVTAVTFVSIIQGDNVADLSCPWGIPLPPGTGEANYSGSVWVMDHHYCSCQS